MTQQSTPKPNRPKSKGSSFSHADFDDSSETEVKTDSPHKNENIAVKVKLKQRKNVRNSISDVLNSNSSKSADFHNFKLSPSAHSNDNSHSFSRTVYQTKVSSKSKSKSKRAHRELELEAQLSDKNHEIMKLKTQINAMRGPTNEQKQEFVAEQAQRLASRQLKQIKNYISTGTKPTADELENLISPDHTRAISPVTPELNRDNIYPKLKQFNKNVLMMKTQIYDFIIKVCAFIFIYLYLLLYISMTLFDHSINVILTRINQWLSHSHNGNRIGKVAVETDDHSENATDKCQNSQSIFNENFDYLTSTSSLFKIFYSDYILLIICLHRYLTF